MRYEVNFSKFLSEENSDVWKFQKIRAKNEEEAIEIIRKNNTHGNSFVNYIISCVQTK